MLVFRDCKLSPHTLGGQAALRFLFVNTGVAMLDANARRQTFPLPARCWVLEL